MPSIETLIAPNISDEDFVQLASLSCTVFPAPARDPVSVARGMRQAWLGYAGPPELRGRRFVVRDGGRIVANANLFPRPVVTARGPQTIAALCAVMAHPDVRGRGFGTAVVRAAFACVDAGEFPFALFQAGDDAKGFYEKLGCRIVTNPVVNSRDAASPKANPFWERWVMCYLPVGQLPDGEIDLLGRGY